MNKQSTIYTVIFIFVVSFAFVFLLSLTNQGTVEMVRRNQELARQGAVLTAFGFDAESPDEVQEQYASVVADPEQGLYVAQVDGRTVYGKEFIGPGLWGSIEGVIAVTSDLSEIVGLEIVTDNETPGLGGRINENWFKEQFRGEKIATGGLIVRAMEGDGDPDPANSLVDGITGATRTSESIQAIVNRELEALQDPSNRDALNELAARGAQS